MVHGTTAATYSPVSNETYSTMLSWFKDLKICTLVALWQGSATENLVIANSGSADITGHKCHMNQTAPTAVSSCQPATDGGNTLVFSADKTCVMQRGRPAQT